VCHWLLASRCERGEAPGAEAMLRKYAGVRRETRFVRPRANRGTHPAGRAFVARDFNPWDGGAHHLILYLYYRLQGERVATDGASRARRAVDEEMEGRGRCLRFPGVESPGNAAVPQKNNANAQSVDRAMSIDPGKPRSWAVKHRKQTRRSGADVVRYVIVYGKKEKLKYHLHNEFVFLLTKWGAGGGYDVATAAG